MEQQNTPKDRDESALDAALRAALYRRDCPTTMELGDYQMDLLAEDERARIQRHVSRCPHCQAELSRLTNLVSDARDAPAPGTLPEPAPAPDPGWRQVALESGRAWLDQQTGRWRQVWVSLSSLGSHPAGTPALAGLMGADVGTPRSLPGAVYISGAEANIEIKIRAVPEPTPADLNLCRLEVDVSLKDRFGDFSGVQVTLFRDRFADTQVTNGQGEVSFSGLPSDQLANMSLVVILPK